MEFIRLSSSLGFDELIPYQEEKFKLDNIPEYIFKLGCREDEFIEREIKVLNLEIMNMMEDSE